MLSIYGLLANIGWSIYKFADKRRYEIMRNQILAEAKNGNVFWQDFFEHKPNGNPFNTADIRDVFQDDEEI